LANQSGAKVGDTIELFRRHFKIVGVFEANALENGMVIIPFTQLQILNNMKEKATAFLIEVETPSGSGDKSQNIEDVQSALKKLEYLDPTEMEDPVTYTLHVTSSTEHSRTTPQIQLADALVLLVSSISLLLGSLGMMLTMFMSVYERTREIGVLRALGWRKSRILLMVLCESWFICLGSAILGVLGAYVVVWLFSFEPTIQRLSPSLNPEVWWQAAIVALLMGFVGGIYPAFRAARLLPTEAVRHE
jgi:putative ABC transport system permease protein